MAGKLLICISALSTSAAHWRGNRIGDCRTFVNDEQGLASFREYLTGYHGVPAYLMVDAVEEDYRYETLPHTFGADRAEMVNRKIKQHYRNTPYAAAWRQGRESGKRRDDRYLLSALTNPELVNDWLAAVAEQHLPVAGIYLLPMVSTALLDKLQLKLGNLLVVAQHGTGLRLTFFRDRQFRLSRLTRVEGSRGGSRARFIADEISNTRLYLHAQRNTTLEEQLTVVLLDRNDELETVVQDIARDNPSLDCVRLGRAELAQRLGIAESLLDLTPDAIYLQLLGHKVPPSNLASAAVTAGYRRYQARRGIYAAAAAVTLAAATWSGIDFWHLREANADIANASRQTSQLQAQYREITRQFPAAPTSAENLKAAVEIAQKLRQSLRTPDQMTRIVSQALEGTPAVTLRRFGWKYGVNEIDPSGFGTTAPDENAAPPAAGGAVQRRQSGLIEGEIRPFRGDYRAAIDTINAFAARLRRDPAVAEVRVVKLPLNVNPGLALTGNTLDARDQTSTAEFRIVLVMSPAA